jgi:hypothetical protein
LGGEVGLTSPATPKSGPLSREFLENLFLA